MSTQLFAQPMPDHNSSLRLKDGSRVAVIGGGPAGSFFSYFLLDLADRAGVDLEVDIFETRDFSRPAPQGCNMCAGVVSETLVQNLATEGINLPASVVQRAIDSYVLHTDLGSQRIDSAIQEKRIGVVFRGAGPNGVREFEFYSFDEYLLSLAESKGASIVRSRVTGVEMTSGLPHVMSRSKAQAYDLLVVAAGVNTAAHKLFENGDLKYRPPKTTKTALREYRLGKDIIEKYFGSSLHVFLLDVPRLDFAMIVPKGDYASVCLLGKDIDDSLLNTFLNAPEVRDCFPSDWRWDQPDCRCSPRINVRAAVQPYADRVVFIGDSGVTRLYKDGIGAAYRAAKAAASTAILQGISKEDFSRYYGSLCKSIEMDNLFGKLIFSAAHIVQRMPSTRKAMMKMTAAEQQAPGFPQHMSSVLWDTFTGSAPYQDVFLRTLNPAFIGRFMEDLAHSLIAG